MEIDENSIEISVKNAVENMFREEHDIFETTAESNITEWNLAHHLAIQLKKEFPQCSCDVEIRKPNADSYTRPDIILHKRGVHEKNFLIVETKFEDASGTNDDFDKIVRHYFREPLDYNFGCVVNFSINGASDTQINVFANT